MHSEQASTAYAGIRLGSCLSRPHYSSGGMGSFQSRTSRRGAQGEECSKWCTLLACGSGRSSDAPEGLTKQNMLALRHSLGRLSTTAAPRPSSINLTFIFISLSGTQLRRMVMIDDRRSSITSAPRITSDLSNFPVATVGKN